MAQEAGFKRVIYSTRLFSIVSFQTARLTNQPLVIYIEGDGLAWKNKYRISQNPTPENPVGLKLALADGYSNVVYLARPCQYLQLHNEPGCHPDYWTSKRVSTETIEAFNTVLDDIKRETDVDRLRLVGYSGGGSIAAILAAERQDVIDLRTVAGNLDIEAFSAFHRITPLTGSINPVDLADRLADLPQLHFYSTNDEVVVPALLDSYLAALEKVDNRLACIETREVSDTTHHSGWQLSWPTLAALPVDCRYNR